jgi:hypothetical protein
MANATDEPRGADESPMDRFLRFGTALFAVKKDELPKRNEREKPKRKKRASKETPAPD